MTWGWLRRFAAALIPLATACPRDMPTPVERPPSIRVRTFTDASPVRAISSVGPVAVAATERGLVRWDLVAGTSLALTAEHGLPADDVLAIAADPDRDAVWVATSAGVGRYDVAVGTFEPMPPPPTDRLTAFARAARAVAAAEDGVWVGGGLGLAHASKGESWREIGLDAPVNALHGGGAATLWIGAEDGLRSLSPTGALERFGPERGCELAAVRLIGDAPGGGVLAVGDNAEGEQRIAVVRDGDCRSFRASPAEPWTALASMGDDLVVAMGRELFRVSLSEQGVRRLRREGLRLLPVGGPLASGLGSAYVARGLGMRAPRGTGALAVAEGDVLIGTRELGIAQVRLTPRGPRVKWLRRSELAGSGDALSVACRAADDCVIATGDRVAWRYAGGRFQPLRVEGAALFGVVRAPGGELYATYRVGREPRVRIGRVEHGRVDELPALALTTPGTAAGISFSRVSPRGALWVGLTYEDTGGERRSHGVAEVDPTIELVAYHRASRDPADRERGALPIPVTANDIAFLGEDEVWLASHEGAVRVRGREVEVYGEDRGLVSEVLRSVAASSGGIVFAAARTGIGVFDGERWSHPRALQRAVQTVRVGADGRLWMATPRGVAVFDGARVRRLDARRGLLDDRVADIEIDGFGRVWALGRTGMSLISP